MSTIFLTSTGISNEHIRQEFIHVIGINRDIPVAIITTASYEKSENKYAQIALKQFRELGFVNVDFVDFEENPNCSLQKYGVIYVCGGNTFYLLYHLKKSGADKMLFNLLNNTDVIYIGVSAGSIILGPTIEIASVVDPDPNEVGLIDMKGLGVVTFEVHPHYESEHEKDILEYEKRNSRKVIRLSNSQAFVVSSLGEKMVG